MPRTLTTIATLLAAALALGCDGSEGPVVVADDDASPDDDASGDDDASPDDDATPDDDSSPVDDDTTPPDDDTTPAADITGVVLIVLDTFRADNFGCSSPVGLMPSLEARVPGGACFETAISNSSWTTPGTATILTGTHVQTHGMEDPPDYLAGDVRVVSEILADSGYVSFQKSANNHASDNGIQGRFTAHDNTDNEDGYMPSELDAEVTTGSLAILDAHGVAPGTRFFLHAQYVAPHPPYCPPGAPIEDLEFAGIDWCAVQSTQAIATAARDDDTVRDHARDMYDREAVYSDEQIAALIDGLDARGLLDGTLFVFTADHGEEFFEHGHWGHNDGVTREQTQVPLFFWGPGVPAGTVVPGTVSTVDIVPTILDLAGLPADPGVEGRSLVPLMDDPERTPPYRAIARDILNRTDEAPTETITATSPIDDHLWTLVTVGVDDPDPLLFHTEVDPALETEVSGVPGNAATLEVLKTMLEESVLPFSDWVDSYFGE